MPRIQYCTITRTACGCANFRSPFFGSLEKGRHQNGGQAVHDATAGIPLGGSLISSNRRITGLWARLQNGLHRSVARIWKSNSPRAGRSGEKKPGKHRSTWGERMALGFAGLFVWGAPRFPWGGGCSRQQEDIIPFPAALEYHDYVRTFAEGAGRNRQLGTITRHVFWMSGHVGDPPQNRHKNTKTATKPMFALHCFTPNRGSKIAGSLRDETRKLILFSMVCDISPRHSATKNTRFSMQKKCKAEKTPFT